VEDVTLAGNSRSRGHAAGWVAESEESNEVLLASGSLLSGTPHPRMGASGPGGGPRRGHLVVAGIPGRNHPVTDGRLRRNRR
jgi:hypothetical protein